uniref:Secreted protein n=1 Tax=Sipha flava TaxID=143950 RepID=A0A2S2QI66_9HEMI
MYILLWMFICFNDNVLCIIYCSNNHFLILKCNYFFCTCIKLLVRIQNCYVDRSIVKDDELIINTFFFRRLVIHLLLFPVYSENVVQKQSCICEKSNSQFVTYVCNFQD